LNLEFHDIHIVSDRIS